MPSITNPGPNQTGVFGCVTCNRCEVRSRPVNESIVVSVLAPVLPTFDSELSWQAACKTTLCRSPRVELFNITVCSDFVRTRPSARTRAEPRTTRSRRFSYTLGTRRSVIIWVIKINVVLLLAGWLLSLYLCRQRTTHKMCGRQLLSEWMCRWRTGKPRREWERGKTSESEVL